MVQELRRNVGGFAGDVLGLSSSTPHGTRLLGFGGVKAAAAIDVVVKRRGSGSDVVFHGGVEAMLVRYYA